MPRNPGDGSNPEAKHEPAQGGENIPGEGLARALRPSRDRHATGPKRAARWASVPCPAVQPAGSKGWIQPGSAWPPEWILVQPVTRAIPWPFQGPVHRQRGGAVARGLRRGLWALAGSGLLLVLTAVEYTVASSQAVSTGARNHSRPLDTCAGGLSPDRDGRSDEPGEVEGDLAGCPAGGMLGCPGNGIPGCRGTCCLAPAGRGWAPSASRWRGSGP